MVEGTYKMVSEFITWEICIGIFEIDHNELFVLVRREKERRLPCRRHPQDVSVLRLVWYVSEDLGGYCGRTHIVVRKN